MGADNARAAAGWRFVRDALLHTYGQVYFSHSIWLGAALLACTFLAPAYGACGLFGVMAALATASFGGWERQSIRSGALLFNSLLASLAVAHVAHTCPVTWQLVALLLPVAAILSVVLTVGMSAFCYRQCGLPALSLPFVAVHFLLYFTVAWMSKSYPEPWFLVPAIPAEGIVKCYLESFGAITFLSHTTVGLVVWVSVACWSRWAVFYATAAFAAGMVTLAALPAGVPAAEMSFIAFNFIFCGIALGGAVVIPSRGSLLLALGGSVVCALLAVAEWNYLGAFGVPPMALAFNVVVLAAVYALQQRTATDGLQVAAGIGQPEANLRRFAQTQARFPDALLPSIRCPFAGERVVTQGFDGPYTHRGDWRFALDYEVHDPEGGPAPQPSAKLSEYYTFGIPVLAPEAGVVMRTVNQVEDREPGGNNFGDNWGNLVILRLDSGWHVSLCHLQQGTVRVTEGQRVQPGELLGLCGNSGRSPVPHLHLQMQALPITGAPSAPFRQRHYLQRRDKRWCYHATGVPPAGARIRDAVPNRQVAACFDNLGGRRDRFRVQTDDRTWTEEITCRVNQYGDYEFRSSLGGCLTARIIDHAFYVLDCQLPLRGLLSWIWLGLGHVPFIETDRVDWNDRLARQPLLTGPGAWACSLFEPLSGITMLEVGRRFGDPLAGVVGSDLCVQATVDPPRSLWPCRKLPTRIETQISRCGWIQSMRVETRWGEISVHREDLEASAPARSPGVGRSQAARGAIHPRAAAISHSSEC